MDEYGGVDCGVGVRWVIDAGGGVVVGGGEYDHPRPGSHHLGLASNTPPQSKTDWIPPEKDPSALASAYIAPQLLGGRLI